MAADHGLGWYDPETLEPSQRRALSAYLRLRRPIGVVGQGERNDAFLRELTVRSAAAFEVDGMETWGILETVEHGALVVPADLAAAATVARASVALRRLGARVGPTRRRLEAAQAAVEERPAVRRLRARFIAAAVAHAALHGQLERWATTPQA
ncbi:hypothetical protein [Agromyces badenianii]|uniref:hypothetical protein n=1 Tax=Agromyces badenianii TaxID=2080742 RepID=UPI0011B28C0B|nr:hypothetical protein [Agromyces badenianii]